MSLNHIVSQIDLDSYVYINCFLQFLCYVNFLLKLQKQLALKLLSWFLLPVHPNLRNTFVTSIIILALYQGTRDKELFLNFPANLIETVRTYVS